MATFVKHEPCSKCGSRDNLARYDDGSAYCFGCGHTERSSKYVPRTVEAITKEIKLPADSSTQIDKVALDWLHKYNITDTERIKYRMLWSAEKQQLIFPLYDGNSNLLAWQARCFDPNARAKYFSTIKVFVNRTGELIYCFIFRTW